MKHEHKLALESTPLILRAWLLRTGRCVRGPCVCVLDVWAIKDTQTARGIAGRRAHALGTRPPAPFRLFALEKSSHQHLQQRRVSA